MSSSRIRPPRAAEWPSLAHLVRAGADRWGDHPAVIDGQRRVSYREFSDRVDHLAAGMLADGLRHGDRVAIWAPNSLEWLLVACATMRVGGIVVPVNTRFKGEEAVHVLTTSRARMLFTVGDFLGNDYLGYLRDASLPQLRRRILMPMAGGAGAGWDELLAAGRGVDRAELDRRTDAIAPTDVSDIMFTSGTTGSPKGVMVTHEQTLCGYGEEARLLHMNHSDVMLLTSPLFHAFGYKCSALSSFMYGATVIPMATLDAGRALELIERERVTLLQGPPTMFLALMRHPRFPGTDVSSMRAAVCGSTRVPHTLFDEIRSAFGLQGITSGYGLTESCGFATYFELGVSSSDLAASSGPPIEGVEIRIQDPETGDALPAGTAGEILIRGYNVMIGYFEDPVHTAEVIDGDGWLHSGDIGLLDEKGRVVITDRLKDMFITGGFNAYPAEIEHLLERHPQIAQAAVVGTPDDYFGEVGFAFVVPAPGAQPDPEEIISWSRAHMANFKVPRGVQVVSSLPLTANGKVQKHRLAPLAAQARAASTPEGAR